LAKAATRVMVGTTIQQLRDEGVLPAWGDGADAPAGSPIAVKEAVLPFGRFQGVDTVLGPEMKSTGEVMGLDSSFGIAYAKSQAGAYATLPTKGRAFVSVANRDKRMMILPVQRLVDLGFEIYATEGTSEILRRNGVRSSVLRKHRDGTGPNGEPTTVDAILAGDVDLIVNTPYGVGPRVDGYDIRTAAVSRGVPCITTVQGFAAAVQGIEALIRGDIGVRSLQEHAADLKQLRADADAARELKNRGE
jgi:carbamoyl-phosphate synthase large subunit